jgi:glycosyltransferase involved in cell wall biosynthesis
MYNEQAIAKANTEIILSYTNKLPPLATVLVVNDGSRDATKQIIEELLPKYDNDRLHLISHPNNRGYGAALQIGIKFASDNNYDYTIFMDSDLTNHPKYLESFYEKIEEGWDYIKATRYSKGGSVDGVPWGHRIMSIAGNYIARFLYGLPLTDYTNGFRAVKTDLLKQINYTENGFVIIMEELYQAKSLTKSFCEIPYILTSRAENHGQSHFSYGPGVCMQYLKYAIKSFFQKC